MQHWSGKMNFTTEELSMSLSVLLFCPKSRVILCPSLAGTVLGFVGQSQPVGENQNKNAEAEQ